MKHLFSLLAVALVASATWAQTTVTLSVDMSNETVSPNGVHVAGSFQGWDPGATMMTDNGDGTWSYTFTSDTAAAYQYKFINGNAWGFDETGIPEVCAYGGNRQIEVDGVTSELSSMACFNNCLACGVDSTLVRFRVDMTNEDVSPFGVHVAGDFQGWDPASTELTDPDGDMIYEHLAVLDTAIASIEYKFINGDDWSDPNENLTGFECANQFGNRVFDFEGQNEYILSSNAAGDAYCYDACTSCVLPLNITFTVDMSQVASVSPNGVHLAGAFQGWDPAGTPMSDNGDGTWSVTLEVSPGDQPFKFINSNAWDGNEENMNGQPCGQDGNRLATFVAGDTEYTACFNQCPGVACVPDPDPADLTFQVDASEIELGDSSLYIFGGFTGWQGGAIEMTDNGDGTWEYTQEVSGGVNVDYKYSIGFPTNDGNDENGVFVTLLGDSTNFEDEGCGVPNGFGGYNRRWERSGSDEVIPLHCYNRCGECLGAVGCTDMTACNYDPAAETDNGSCFYPGDSCDDGDDMTTNDVVDEDCECMGEVVAEGCTDLEACNYTDGANVDDGSCLYTNDACDDMDDTTINDMIDDMCMCVGEAIVEGCTDPEACNYNAEANVDDGTCAELDAIGDCGGDCFADTNDDGICDELIVVGCTNMEACNYDMDANTDDGSCLVIGEACDDGDDATINDTVDENCGCVGEVIVEGCTDETACNYDMNANVDDGSCDYTSCAGCTDETACNYDAAATIDDDSCVLVGDSCDDGDDATINDTIDENCDCMGEVDGIEEASMLAFGMFPNPTTGEVTLRVQGFCVGVNIQVMDAAGRVVWTQQNLALNYNTTIDLSGLRPGTYNVMLSDERGVSVKRLIIQR